MRFKITVVIQSNNLRPLLNILFYIVITIECSSIGQPLKNIFIHLQELFQPLFCFLGISKIPHWNRRILKLEQNIHDELRQTGF